MKKVVNDQGQFGTKQNEVDSQVSGATKEPTPKESSQIRMEMLTKSIFEKVEEISTGTGTPFTLYELNDVLLRVAHSFNKRFLDTQFEMQPVEEIKVNDAVELKN